MWTTQLIYLRTITALIWKHVTVFCLIWKCVGFTVQHYWLNVCKCWSSVLHSISVTSPGDELIHQRLAAAWSTVICMVSFNTWDATGPLLSHYYDVIRAQGGLPQYWLTDQEFLFSWSPRMYIKFVHPSLPSFSLPPSLSLIHLSHFLPLRFLHSIFPHSANPFPPSRPSPHQTKWIHPSDGAWGCTNSALTLLLQPFLWSCSGSHKRKSSSQRTAHFLLRKRDEVEGWEWKKYRTTSLFVCTKVNRKRKRALCVLRQ